MSAFTSWALCFRKSVCAFFPETTTSRTLSSLAGKRRFVCARTRSSFPIPDLAVEVLSRSAEQRDRGVKFEDYAVHGVGEYWIIDAQSQAVEQYCPAKGTYVPVPRSPANELPSRVVERLSILVASVFDEAENLKALRQILASPAGGR